MDLDAIRAEVYGPFSYLNDGGAQAARVLIWVNQAYHEVCTQAQWPFLEASASGTAPLTVSDLGTIISVVDSNSYPLMPVQYDPLTKIVWGPLSTTGSAAFYYVTGGTVVNTYPVPTGSITVRYCKVPTNLSAGSDVPLVPDKYRDLIALGALRRAAIDNQAWDAAAAYRQEWDARMQDMLSSEIEPPRYQQIVSGSEDW